MRNSSRADVIVCVSGMAATGKSTLARRLAKHLGLRYVSGGDALKQLAVDRGYRAGGKGWWETPQGLKFLEERSSNPEFDKLVDQKLVDLVKRGDVIVDSWVLPWLFENGFKIWLNASSDIRARRLAKRSHLGIDDARNILQKKDDESREIYKKLYGVSLGKDFSPFHLVLDTDRLSSTEVFKIVRTVIKFIFDF